MGALAEVVRRCARGSSTAATIKNELLTVLRLDPAFQQGSADRALGRWYYKVPGLFGGTKKKSEEHLRQLAQLRPAEHRVAFLPRRDAARRGSPRRSARGVPAVLDAPLDPDWAPEDREFKEGTQAPQASSERDEVQERPRAGSERSATSLDDRRDALAAADARGGEAALAGRGGGAPASASAAGACRSCRADARARSRRR